MQHFHKHDGGREAAGFKGRAGDCVTRAVAIATGWDYRETYNVLAAANAIVSGDGVKSARNGVAYLAFRGALDAGGWIPLLDAGTKVKHHDVAHFADKHRSVIAQTPRHMYAIRDGVMLDTWDSRKVVSTGAFRTTKCVQQVYVAGPDPDPSVPLFEDVKAAMRALIV